MYQQAIEELNIKPKFWKDLLTDVPISRKDIIHLQDPLNFSGRNMQQFDHVKRNRKLVSDEEEAKLRVRILIHTCGTFFVPRNSLR